MVEEHRQHGERSEAIEVRKSALPPTGIVSDEGGRLVAGHTLGRLVATEHRSPEEFAFAPSAVAGDRS